MNDKEITLPYGKSSIAFTPPRHIHWQFLHKELQVQTVAELDVIEQGINDIVAQLANVYNPGETLLIIIPDHTRKCRLPIVLPLLTRRLQTELDVKPEFLVANGSHVVQPEATLRALVGDDIYNHFKVQQHDAKDSTLLVDLGSSDFGTPMLINKKAVQADHLLTVNGILYHYFAGFGGGPKMLLPGVAGYETIRQNHSRTIDPNTGMFHPECYDGNLVNNPVYTDLKQVLAYFPKVLSLQFALDTSGGIVAASAGPVLQAQQEIIAVVKSLYDLPLQEKAGVVVASAGGFPADVNLVQTHKAIHHAYQAVKPGGVLIMLAACQEGVGSATFMPAFDAANVREMGLNLLENYVINGHTALALKMKSDAISIIFVSDLESKVVARTGMVPAASVKDAFEKAGNVLQPGQTSGFIFPQANLLVPRYN